MNNIKRLRQERHMTQEELGSVINVQKAAISKYEVGRVEPSADVLRKLANFFNVSTDYLLGRTSTPSQQSATGLSPREEREIESDLEDMIHSLDGAAAYGGDSDDAEDRELLRASLKQAMILSKRIAKKKYTPKKYRHED